MHRVNSKHDVTILSGLNEFVVKFFGPTGSECQSPLQGVSGCSLMLTQTVFLCGWEGVHVCVVWGWGWMCVGWVGVHV